MRHKALRWSEADGFELRCEACGDYWPLNDECWRMNRWDRCLFCYREYNRFYQAMRRLDPSYRMYESLKASRAKRALREQHPEYLRAYEREMRARQRARRRVLDRERVAA